MPRLSMNEMTTYRWSFEEDVARYREAAFPAIGVWRQKLSDFGEAKGIELLAESSLAVSNLLWAGGFTGSDGRTLRESIADAAEAIQLASDLQAGCLVVYSGARGGHTQGHARRILRDALRELLPQAEQLGVTLALEPMHPECAADWTFLTSLDDTLALLDELDHPRLQLAFDTYHLGLDERSIERAAALVPRIAVVHLGDGLLPCESEQNRCRLGRGNVPLRELITALCEAGYDGDFDVELIGREIEQTDYCDLLAQSRHAYYELLPLAR